MLISKECIELHDKFSLFSGAHVPSLKHPMGQKDLVPVYKSKEKQGQATVLALWQDQFHSLPVTVSANYAVS